MSDSTPTIYSPIVAGSGVSIVHRTLQEHIPEYHVREFSPYIGLFPPISRLLDAQDANVTHTLPDLGCWHRAPGSRTIITFHNFYLDTEFHLHASRSQQLFYRHILAPNISRAMDQAHTVTAVSQFTAELVRSYFTGLKSIEVIDNGVDAVRFTPGPTFSDTVRILFAGNPSQRKGFHHIEVLASELPRNSVIKVTAGMRSSAKGENHSNSRIIEIPRLPHDEMPSLYRSSDILFFPTYREGMSLVVLEAMACGLPVVASRCSSLPEQIIHGYGGFLFEPGNRTEMRNFLERLIDNPSLRHDMGEFNRQRVLERFRLDAMLEKYKMLFDDAAR